MMPGTPAPVLTVFEGFELPMRQRLLEIRELIFEVAQDDTRIGALTETLKWGEPAYVTEESRSGTTIRLGMTRTAPSCCAVFFHCQTRLIADFRSRYDAFFCFEGNRALLVDISRPLPRAPLAVCVHEALTYHARSRRTKG